MLTSEEKLLSTIAHLGILFGAPIMAPLLIYLLSNNSFIKMQAKEAMFFHGGMILAGIIGGILTFVLIGFLILPVVGLLTLIAPIVATVKVWGDEDYSYPITGQWARKF
ncbi:DUF4870 domain-containing protein [Halonatronum saccharophilum]|uniref:DUF4870 domain-containing protein n=1 Tax=Halonatronum saccharophilum TaxID=150060 RepID=UPI0004806465|nr:DUF4870 domain-containing protein [Halonatronum saccharophilum]